MCVSTISFPISPVAYRGEEVVMADVWQLAISEGEGEEIECPGIPFSFVHLHGVIMYLAWGLLLPLGALLGRYYRHYWPVWFILHIIIQVRPICLVFMVQIRLVCLVYAACHSIDQNWPVWFMLHVMVQVRLVCLVCTAHHNTGQTGLSGVDYTS